MTPASSHARGLTLGKVGELGSELSMPPKRRTSHVGKWGWVVGGTLFVLILFAPTEYMNFKAAVFAGIVFTTIVASARKRDRIRIHRSLALPIIGVSSVGLLYILYGLARGNPGAYRTTTVYVIWPILYLMVISIVRRTIHLTYLTRAVVVAGGLSGIYGSLYVASSTGLLPRGTVPKLFATQRVNAGYVDHIASTFPFLASSLFIAPFLIALLIVWPTQMPWPVKRVWLWVTLLSQLVLAVVSDRTAYTAVMLLALPITYGLRAVSRPRGGVDARQSLGRGISIVTVFAAATYAIIQSLGIKFSALVADFSSSFDTSNNAAAQIRSAEYTALISGWRQHPIFGSGMGAVAPGYIRDPSQPWAYEQVYVAQLFHTGIVGAVIYSLAIVVPIIRVLSRTRHDRELHAYATAISVGVICFLIANATNPYLAKLDGLWIVFAVPAVLNISTNLLATRKLNREVGDHRTLPEIRRTSREFQGHTQIRTSPKVPHTAAAHPRPVLHIPLDERRFEPQLPPANIPPRPRTHQWRRIRGGATSPRQSRGLWSVLILLGAISSISLIAKLVGFLRDVALADRFGADAAVSAFYSYTAFQATVVIVLSQALTITVATRLMRGETSTSKVTLTGLAISLIAGAAQALLSHPISYVITSGSRDQITSVQQALVWTAPGSAGLVFLGCISGILTAYGRLKWTAALTGGWSALALAFLYTSDSPTRAIFLGWSAAVVITSIFALVTLRGGTLPTLDKRDRAATTRSATGLITLAMLVNQASFVVERNVASRLGTVPVAAVGYAYKLVTLPQSVVIGGLSIWLIPHFIRLADLERHAFNRQMTRILVPLLITFSVTALILIFGSHVIVDIVYHHGAFSPTAAHLTSRALIGFAVGSPAVALYVVLARALQARRAYGRQIVASVFGFLLTLGTIYPLSDYLGVLGITLATSVGNVGACSAMWILILRLNRSQPVSTQQRASEATLGHER